jgi:hypothetical protein
MHQNSSRNVPFTLGGGGGIWKTPEGALDIPLYELFLNVLPFSLVIDPRIRDQFVQFVHCVRYTTYHASKEAKLLPAFDFILG